MNFDYTDEQNMLRDSIAKWAAGQYDFDKRREALSHEDAWKTNWAAFAELGLLAAPLPEDFGGLGGGAIDISVVTEEFGKALIVEPYVPTVVLGAGALKYAGNAAQKDEHLTAIASGERVIAFAQAEPKSRWTLHDVATSAKKDGAGWVLNGHKAVVLGAPQADHLLISARTAGAQRDEKGISLFLVPKSANGVSTRDYPTMDGTRAAEVYLENVSVGAANLIGEVDNALSLIERIVDEANAAYCSEAVGCMRMMSDLTREYAKTRKQFGKAIADFQVLQHRMVDMFMATEESYSMALRATIKLGESNEERARAVSAAKVSIGKHSRFVGQAAVQIHGGMGVTDEMRVGHYFKRVTMLDATFGNVDSHLKRYTALSAAA
ncbi:MAG TPA: acyl-CoA dehydrogenase family protein [Vitreimonas sp.]|uniref:acyl-CoA dehydrogenase family protein n=1 Tax=Vitreimonas sp. TaxID=3069702 RepID=UPI002D2E83A5|nr:acyl-CoA dehydrogenase family protein [Vitreimonas sp.]HYD86098.1 acyl-CoA dehydrogenase family protein [Vitreimonas sp.]